jgi:hypothetical protein
MKVRTRMWAAIGVLVVLSPLGLILPRFFRAGTPFGETRIADIWQAPLSDYAFKGWEDKGLGRLSLSYIISAAAGAAAVIIVIFLLGRLLTRNGQE